MTTDVKSAIDTIIRAVAAERGIVLPELRDDTAIVDELGFSSMTVAALIANLEDRLGVDPFQRDDVMITDVRTIGDLRAVYARCLEDC